MDVVDAYPRVVERYMGFDVRFDPVRGVYYASH